MSEDRPARRIEYRKLSELEPDPRNPRAHESAHLVRKSMGRFGFVEPIVVDGRTGYIVSGHGRVKTLEAMRRDGEAPPEGVRVNKKGAWLVPVVEGWASDSDTEAGAALIAMNRTTELGGWVDDELLELLADIEHADDLGFDDDALEEIRTAVDIAVAEHEEPEPLADPEDAPAPPEEPRAKLGDVWQLGPHRVMCGSATSATDVRTLLDGATPDLLLTDPPYSSGGFQEAGRSAGSIGTKRKDGTPEILADNLSTRGYRALMSEALRLSPTAYAYVFTDWRMWINLYDVLEAGGYGVRSMIVWDKGSPGMGTVWRTQHELVAWAARAKTSKASMKDALGNVRTVPRSGNELHPTQKPVALLADLLAPLQGLNLRGVYDPFGGSGSTLIAADAAGLPCYVMELDPGFVDVIVERWQRATGGVAELVRSGDDV